jgi:hypothetical protein
MTNDRQEICLIYLNILFSFNLVKEMLRFLHMDKYTDVSIDSLLENLISTNSSPVHRENEKPVTTWLPEDSKEKYDRIQDATSRKFSKTLKEIIIRSIDMTYREVLGNEDFKKSSGF